MPRNPKKTRATAGVGRSLSFPNFHSRLRRVSFLRLVPAWGMLMLEISEEAFELNKDEINVYPLIGLGLSLSLNAQEISTSRR